MKTKYVQDGNLYDGLGAAQLNDVTMHTFCVEADRRKLQAWLDKTFATPSNGAVKYEALGSKIFLGVSELGHVELVAPSQPTKGYTREIDVLFWILARKRGDGPFALRWIPAYLFVDSGPVLVTGREVWGFPKQLGRFSFSPKGDDPAKAREYYMDGWVLSPYAPDTVTRWAPMVEIRPKEKKSHDGTIWDRLESFAETAVSRLAGDMSSIAGHIETALGKGALTMSFLKQFPDASDPTYACYQAIIEAEAKVTGFEGSGLTDDLYEVQITSYDDHPFAEELGLAPGWQDVGRGIWVQFAFRQELGQEIWKAEI